MRRKAYDDDEVDFDDEELENEKVDEQEESESKEEFSTKVEENIAELVPESSESEVKAELKQKSDLELESKAQSEQEAEHKQDRLDSVITTEYDVADVYCVRLKDGTILEYLMESGQDGFTDEVCQEYYSIRSFDRVIDVDNVDALLFKDSSDTYIVPINN